MHRLLITGGAGFIGSNFVHYVLQTAQDVEIWNLDALTYAGSLENLKDLPDSDRHHFVEGDICDQLLVERLLRDQRIDTIVHFAAESHVDRSIYGPAAFVRTNIEGTFSLLEAARKVGLEVDSEAPGEVRFHHVSTDEVYGSLAPDEPAFTEQTAYAPNSPYAASKAASDHLVRAYAHTYRLPVTITNCSNNYGPRQFPEKLIPLMIQNGLNGRSLPVYGDGQQVRDWIYVEDHCQALWRVLERGRTGETYNIGGDNQPTNLQIVQQICGLLDELAPDSGHVPHGSLITFVTDRPGHDRRYAMDIGKVKKELDWQPSEQLDSGLRKTIAWYLMNTTWLQAIMQENDYQSWLKLNYAARGGSS